MIRTLFLFLFAFLSLASAQEVPGLYIVEMLDPAKPGERVGAASRQAFRAALEQRFQVLDATERTLDAFIVRGPADGGASLQSAVGAAGRVSKVYEVKPDLDAAIALHRIPDAWAAVGGEAEAGKGVKIGIIDTGIDVSHPGFEARGLEAPAGYPRYSPAEAAGGVNGKVIVARSYEHLISQGQPSATDSVGHGTGVAMAAAGMRTRAPFAELAGAAPGAWLGAYKVFDSNGSANTAAVLRALDDAVADGMDIVNMSLGQPFLLRPELDPLARAVERAAAGGVLVVKSAGNAGPDPWTGGSPSGAPNLLSVGANRNSREFTGGVSLGELGTLPGVPSDTGAPEPVRAPILDVASIAANGLACTPLPENGLSGRIALIERGTCDFEVKLTGARRAGAVAAIVFSDDRPAAGMATGAARLPAIMLSREDGLRLKALLAETPGLEGEVRFAGIASPADPARVASFSSRGPNGLHTVFPDVLAAGADIYTAAQAANEAGELFDPSGFRTVNGTSFSAPITAGAAAVLKSRRQGLSAAQYKSLIVNSATGLDPAAPVQGTGAGLLNLEAALRATAAADPVSLDFGFQPGVLDRDFFLTNTSFEAETYSLSAEPGTGSRLPELGMEKVTLNPFEAAKVHVRFDATNLDPGIYQGVIRITGSRGGPDARVPYSYIQRETVPARVTLLSAPSNPRAGATATLLFVVTERSGAPLLSPTPGAEALSEGASVLDVVSADSEAAYLWAAQVRLAAAPGLNRFRITAGGVSREVQIRSR